MNNTNQAASVFTEQQILQDSLMSQKHISEGYNTFAGECVNEQLRSTMLGILNEEHKMQADIFNNLQSHGWYQVEAADQQKITQARQKFQAT
jgi:spore coat protein CotF